MLRVVAGELLHRRHRTLALLAGILVATTSFTVLTASSRTQRLEARGTVAKSFRGSYDVLVRPRGARTAVERRTAQVQPNFLALLGVAAVADVLFIGVRERAAELATLAATGWDERTLVRLVALEGVWIGALGATVGAGTGLLGAALFAGALPVGLLLTTLAAAAAGTAVTALAALVPAAWLRRMPLVPLLADE